ncbi:bifunctional tRNA (5-methylaminomethyl-2-thiouridine)(34)-methyltransferase MnmD/FAD-dependent 5-carboxymethylaminomethyl-2-thiouridine(34) oxidoreductase MnmC [Microbulbifer spongiae]|uniref:bifunctional tRNA (5-methylaminomethyl-2-thiouridine)(34)-methyltransferase MnmD/FAD-dependent 5-carboxymethylaminomethyl-2-thiouridine(34) oxidoreductase MnmC n=1 Tax=Microbulbifer spongiae TaxID=2944933 RepID=UPI003F5535A3
MLHEPSHHYAQIEWSENGQPLSRTYGDVYFSTASGLEEAHHVFLQHNALAARWADLGDSERFTIGETGFGTGLNFLAAWALWQKTAPQSAQLHFFSVEKCPLRLQDLRRALVLWPQLQPLSQLLLDNYPALLVPGAHRLQFGQVSLTLVIGEASEALRGLCLQQEQRDRQVDAWFLDGFAPAKNPEMWTPSLFASIATLSRPGATFATFTCARPVRHGLRDAGFIWRKVPGFARKREMLCGALHRASRSQTTATPWYLPPEMPKWPQTAAVIGAGISGATVARALAERGVRVRVFEQGATPGSGGSGNGQGILYAKLSPKPSPNGDFNLHALLFAQRYYRNRCAQVVHLNGLLQLAQTDRERRLQQQVAETLAKHNNQTLAHAVTPAEASALAGVNLAVSGLYFPQAGWLEPQKVCAALLQHDNIELYCDTSIEHLEQCNSGWCLYTVEKTFKANAVILCGARDICRFPQSAPLPLNPIRGQVSVAKATATSRQLKVALCSEGYITPEHRGSQSFGASFKLRETAINLRDSEHRVNLETLAALLPQLSKDFSSQALSGRAALRAATPDYLPVAGPVPNWTSLDTTYAGLRKNRKQLIQQTAQYQRNLYVMGGLGSRGFTYAPLAAEVLTAWLLGETLPVNARLARALHPARFAIRNLGKNRAPITV